MYLFIYVYSRMSFSQILISLTTGQWKIDSIKRAWSTTKGNSFILGLCHWWEVTAESWNPLPSTGGLMIMILISLLSLGVEFMLKIPLFVQDVFNLNVNELVNSFAGKIYFWFQVWIPVAFGFHSHLWYNSSSSWIIITCTF